MAVTLNAIILPDDSVWTNEFSHSAVKQSRSTTLGGKDIIEEAPSQKGRSILLDVQWIDKTVLDALVIERDTVNNTMLLTVADGRIFNVRFNQGTDAILADPVIKFAVHAATDLFAVKLKLFEV